MGPRHPKLVAQGLIIEIPGTNCNTYNVVTYKLINANRNKYMY